MSRPDWLVPGAEVVIYQKTRDSGGTAHLTPTTVDRVLKRDVVLANGRRFNADELKKRNGSWDPVTELLSATNPRVLSAKRANLIFDRRYGVTAAVDEFRRTGQSAGLREALDAYDEAVDSPIEGPE